MKILLPEIIAADFYNSNIAHKNIKESHNRKAIKFEIELPIENGGISYIDSEEMQISPYMIICVKPGQIRHTRFPFKCYYLHLSVTEGLLYDTLMNINDFVSITTPEKYMDIFLSLHKYVNLPSDNSKILMQSLVLELIYMLSNDSQKQHRSKALRHSNYDILNKALKYIQENISGDLTLNTISTHINLSPIHFHNIFKKAMGMTLHQYVEDNRIKKASNLLVTTDWTLSKIAEECGFSSQEYLNIAFKRNMNLTPREYAKGVHSKYDS